MSPTDDTRNEGAIKLFLQFSKKCTCTSGIMSIIYIHMIPSKCVFWRKRVKLFYHKLLMKSSSIFTGCPAPLSSLAIFLLEIFHKTVFFPNTCYLKNKQIPFNDKARVLVLEEHGAKIYEN